MTALEAIEKSALRLSEKERVRLAGTLLSSCPGDLESSAEEVQEAWDNELGRRASEIDSGEIEEIPAEQVFEELNRKSVGNGEIPPPLEVSSSGRRLATMRRFTRTWD